MAYDPQDFDDEPRHRPWSKNALRRTGESLTSGGPWPDNAPTFENVALWFEEVKGYVQALLYLEDWAAVLETDSEPSITGRVKSDDTLREKLLRNASFPLPEVQDIAGVRFEADMTLNEQDVVVEKIRTLFQPRGWACDVVDYRTDVGQGAYRAIHVRLKRQKDGARVEVQVRTRLQGLWSNVYELLSDQLGRGIRYGELPGNPADREMVQEWQGLSVELIQAIEDLQGSLSEPYRAESDRLRAEVTELLRKTLERLDPQPRQL